MQQFEIRTKDLTKLICALDTHSERLAEQVYLNEYSKAGGLVLVLGTFETEAEADKARLDWMEGQMDTDDSISHDSGCMNWTLNGKSEFQKLRNLLDAARQAPQPTVRVISGGEQ